MIGLDGLEPTIVEQLMADGQLPHLAAMRQQGGLGRVATTFPAQTPVAWSTFATGRNPGGHRIFDFLRRDPKTYLPDLALNEYEQKNPFLPPRAVNLRQGTPVWSCLDQAGIGSIVLRCPCTFPPDPTKHRMLSGMGVPDIRGGLGTPTFFTTDPDAHARESEQIGRLERQPDGSLRGALPGPRNPKDRSNLLFELELRLDLSNARVSIQSAGSPRELEVQASRWSEWLGVKFKAGLLVSVRGLVRFYLLRTEPHLELYASPINFDPVAPMFPISHPFDFARDLAEDLRRPYYTTGMVEDHTGLNNDRLSEDAFLAQCDVVWNEREAMMLHQLDRFEQGLFYVLFDTPDRVQHLFWRYREAGHPANRLYERDASHSRAIEDQYRRGDAIVGHALQYADEQTLVIALSDHGFGGFQRGVDLNAWLLKHGYLALKPGLEAGAAAGEFLRGVDWSRTRAYAIGLTGLYFNRRGREAEGIVSNDEVEPLRAELVSRLTGLVDTQRGVAGIRSVVPRETAYSGPFVDQAPDLLVGYTPGYRVGWSASMGGVAADVFEDNTKRWSGDHIIDPEYVPGFLAMNCPYRDANARLIDLAPTILDALGCERDRGMEGESLLS